MVFESLSDFQLRNHLKKNPGKLMTTGLWKYSRHPNYFGESLIWLGFCLSVNVWWVYVSWLTITLSLLYVSGVPLMEQKIKTMSGYTKYSKSTNKFIPWFPR